jgi:hypothetical protein
LDYTHDGLCLIDILGGNRPLHLVILDRPSTQHFWPLDIMGQTVLVSGPVLVRSSAIIGRSLVLTGDVNTTTTLEVVLAPTNVKYIIFNGNIIKASKTSYGTFKGQIAGPPAVNLPQLSTWKYKYETLEKDWAYDDTKWIVANHTSTKIPNASSNPVL